MQALTIARLHALRTFLARSFAKANWSICSFVSGAAAVGCLRRGGGRGGGWLGSVQVGVVGV
jgi:hypothetical protein